ncbi:MAG TPA: class I SAM-dependent methyltransferase [Planctomycetota bacterium]|nr:class I SAM-dependent methyltransferase [Planctomycetota bacterium]
MIPDPATPAGAVAAPPTLAAGAGERRTYDLLARRGLDVLETTPCLLCGRVDGETLVDDPPFRVILCAGCGLGYTSPRVRADKLPELYNAGYFTSESAGDFGYASYTADRDGFVRTFRLKADLLERHVRSGRVLEVGCAAGFFLNELRARGYETWGTEIGEDVFAHARDALGLPNLYRGPLETFEPPPEPFDAAAMFDVIEHIADPLDALRRLRRMLKPGGALLLQTQDVSSLTRRLMGRKWTHFKQLEHVYHFSPTTLRTLLDRAGFDLVELRKRGAGKFVSVGFLIDRMARFHPWLHGTAKLLTPWRKTFLYVNPWDEMLAVARARG